ncbi:unnamed protein product [Camellia sinensis]
MSLYHCCRTLRLLPRTTCDFNTYWFLLLESTNSLLSTSTSIGTATGASFFAAATSFFGSSSTATGSVLLHHASTLKIQFPS